MHRDDVADKTSVSAFGDSGISDSMAVPDRNKTAFLSRKSGGRSGDIDRGRRNHFLYLQNAVDESLPVGLGRSFGSGCDVLRHNHRDDDGTGLHRNRRFYWILNNKQNE